MYVARMNMKKMRNIILVVTAILILACGVFPYELTITRKNAETGEEPVAAAATTAVVFSTNTNIPTITATLVPSSTRAASSTPIPSRTPIPTKTASLTPSVTLTPTRTTYYCPEAAIGTPCP